MRWSHWGILASALLSAPFLFAGRPTAWWWGLPLWVWWSFGCTVLLAAFTAIAILRHWRDVE